MNCICPFKGYRLPQRRQENSLFKDKTPSQNIITNYHTKFLDQHHEYENHMKKLIVRKIYKK